MVTSRASTVSDYLAELPDDRVEPFTRLLETVRRSIDPAFDESMMYGMVTWSVPHALYPGGYHVTPELGVPFISLGNQKNFIGYYHLGLSAEPDAQPWLLDEWRSRTGRKADMGKSCLRIKKLDEIPLDLIGEITARISCEQFVQSYRQADPRR